MKQCDAVLERVANMILLLIQRYYSAMSSNAVIELHPHLIWCFLLTLSTCRNVS